MNHKIKFVASLFVVASGMVFAEPQSGNQYSRTELQSMIRSAHSAPQYQALAAYFRSRQQTFEKQALAEKAEWERRSLVTAAVAQKYPRPVDSSKNRYEYFTYESSQMRQQAEHYEALTIKSDQKVTQ